MRGSRGEEEEERKKRRGRRGEGEDERKKMRGRRGEEEEERKKRKGRRGKEEIDEKAKLCSYLGAFLGLFVTVVGSCNKDSMLRLLGVRK
jgi:hypothetical protein